MQILQSDSGQEVADSSTPLKDPSGIVTDRGLQFRGHGVDFLVEGELVLELKALEKVLPVHHARVLTYMKLLKIKRGVLINFNVTVLVRSVKSFLL